MLFKKIFTLFACISFLFWVKHQTHSFTLQRIFSTDLPYHTQWETQRLSAREEADMIHILSQPFHLIASGSECFVFASAEGQHVIKFFKLEQLRFIYFKKGLFYENHQDEMGSLSNHWLTHVQWKEPFNTWKNRYMGFREFRLAQTFNSCTMAYKELQEETGLIYLHLNPTHHLNKKLTLIDHNAISHEIDLDSAKFLLQKKAIPLEQHFTTLFNTTGDLAELHAQESIDSLLALILSRCKKGFADRDSLNRNFAFINMQAIEIDVGSFSKNSCMQEPDEYKKELSLATNQLRTWLEKKKPALANYLDKKIADLSIITPQV